MNTLLTIKNDMEASNKLQCKDGLEILRSVIQQRLKYYENGVDTVDEDWLKPYSASLGQLWFHDEFDSAFTTVESIVLLIALAPHIHPGFFEQIIQEFFPQGGDFPEFGGIKNQQQRYLQPTGETVLFILAGMHSAKRLQYYTLFEAHHLFYKEAILWIEYINEGQPAMSGRMILAQDWIDKLLLQKETNPRFGLDFPARKLHTDMIWDDMVLSKQTTLQIQDILMWMNHHEKIAKDENLGRKVKPGFRVLFHGPSGTGKTLTASLLGKQFVKDVYRIDLSQIVSKYIGETEKNLESVFRKAESKNWILFFDEADALFGKRTQVQSSHDKYANQEISYLLQRVEDYPGLLILASNYKSNIDEAFIRRFHSIIHFPMPNAAERYQLWMKVMPATLLPNADLGLQDISNKYELSGASILNAMQYAALHCHAAGSAMLRQEDLMYGIKREFMKEEKMI